MRSILVKFQNPVAVEPGVTVDFFWNVNNRGIASGDVSYAEKVNDASVPLFTGDIPQSPSFLMGPWLSGTWLTNPTLPNAQYWTPPVHWGNVKVAGKAKDRHDNYQATSPTPTELFVNSTPLPPDRFRRDSWTGGRQWFTYDVSPQLEA